MQIVSSPKIGQLRVSHLLVDACPPLFTPATSLIHADAVVEVILIITVASFYVSERQSPATYVSYLPQL